MAEPLTLAEIAGRAAAVLPAAVWDYLDGGSGTEGTVSANRAAFDALRLVPRVLRDVSSVSTGGDLCGTPAAMPVAVAPMAYQRLVHPDGELAVARAAKVAGVPFAVPMLSSVPVERVAEAGGPLWFQLYWLRDRGLLADVVARAEAAGCRALMLTVDVPRMGRRLRDVRNEFTLPPDVLAANLTGSPTTVAHRRRDGGSALAADTAVVFDPALTWHDLAWLRASTGLPLLLKGILDPEDAASAAAEGVAGIVVSNHGGRQLDGAIAAIDALPPVAEAVAGRCPVLLDSGVRGGVDVLKALARGADGVLLGRPVLHGLATGEPGVARVLSLVYDELVDAMCLAGCPDLAAARSLRLAPAMPNTLI